MFTSAYNICALTARFVLTDCPCPQSLLPHFIDIVISKNSRNNFISNKYTSLPTFKYIYFKIVPLCNHTLFSPIVNVYETYLEAVL